MKKKTSHVLAGLLFVGCIVSLASCKKKDKDPYHDYTEAELLDLSVRDCSGENGMVASANPYASKIGLEILHKGGNAFDAAVGISFALGLTEPYASGIGGGGIMVGYNASTGDYVTYNFREFLPGGTYDSKGKLVYSKDVIEQADGVRAAGVPTIVKSLLGIIEEQGSGKFGDEAASREAIIGPSVALAKKGFTITPSLGEAISTLEENLCFKRDDTMGEEIRNIYADDDLQTFAKATGETIKNENLANVYQEIIDNGSDGFYKGWVADAILDAIGTSSEQLSAAGNHGLVTQSDLDRANNDDYYPTNTSKYKPLTGKYTARDGKQYNIITATAPSSGGVILIEALNMLEYYNNHYQELGYDSLDELGRNSAEYINLLLTITQLAYGDKQKYIGDISINPATNKPFVDVPFKGLTSKDYAKARLTENYRVGKAYNGRYSDFIYEMEDKQVSTGGGVVGQQNYGDATKYNGTVTELSADVVNYEASESEHFSTTSFSVADKDGNIVSVTQTINHFWGNHIMPEGCGFFLNNNLSSFSTLTSSASYFVPYKHPTSHVMPTIVLDEDENPVATLGSPGSMRIPTAVFETLVNMFEWGDDIQTAIDAPRVYNYCISTGANSDQGYENNEDGHSNPAEISLLGTDTFYRGEKCIFIEQTGSITAETVQEVCDMGYYIGKTYKKINKFFGGVHGITFEGNKLHGGADSRRDGKALGY